MPTKDQAAEVPFPSRAVARVQRQATQIKEWTSFNLEGAETLIREFEYALTRLKRGTETGVKRTESALKKLKAVQTTLKELEKELARL